MRNKYVFNKSKSWVASGEDALLVCAYGPTPGKALKKIGKLIDSMLEQNNTLLLQGVNVTYDDDDVVIVNATVTTWKE